MALESVAKTNDPKFYLPADAIEQVSILSAQVRSIAFCMALSAPRHNEAPQATHDSAAWAIDGLMERIEKLVELRLPEPEARP